jgi:hypothetical protein
MERFDFACGTLSMRQELFLSNQADCYRSTDQTAADQAVGRCRSTYDREDSGKI